MRNDELRMEFKAVRDVLWKMNESLLDIEGCVLDSSYEIGKKLKEERGAGNAEGKSHEHQREALPDFPALLDLKTLLIALESGLMLLLLLNAFHDRR